MDEQIQPKKSFFRHFWWLGAIILVAIVLTAIIIPKKQSIDPDNPPKFIQADFVELDKVYMISKFRSGTGHDFSVGSGETCRSMKHYFNSIDPNQPNYKSMKNPEDKSVYPLPTLEKDVKIFSPVDGTLKFVDFDQIAFDHELDVMPAAYPFITIRLMHVQNAPGIKEGKVKAGQLIGLVLANQSFDIAMSFNSGISKTGYISYFAAMPDEIFAKYQARGVKTRDDLIISKEYRDTHPFSCHGKEVFDENYAFDTPEGMKENLFFLSGYDEVSKEYNEKHPKK